jgi:hypothetical protein
MRFDGFSWNRPVDSAFARDSGLAGRPTDMKRAIGISIHTGWGACVLVGGSMASPEIIANQVIEIQGQSEPSVCI